VKEVVEVAGQVEGPVGESNSKAAPWYRLCRSSLLSVVGAPEIAIRFYSLFVPFKGLSSLMLSGTIAASIVNSSFFREKYNTSVW